MRSAAVAKTEPAPAGRWPSPALPYVAPFGAFILFLALGRLTEAFVLWQVLQAAAVLACLLSISRPVIDLRPARPAASAICGLAVFAVWIAPDLLWPGYRGHWLFSNALTGTAVSSLAPGLGGNIPFLALRAASCTLLVPILEELFWRGWLMRRLVNEDFRAVPWSATTRDAFWVVAVLFASEHGPYWDVGLIAGVAYNAWLARTRSLADSILAHALTNGCLSAYILATGNWQYWL